MPSAAGLKEQASRAVEDGLIVCRRAGLATPGRRRPLGRSRGGCHGYVMVDGQTSIPHNQQYGNKERLPCLTFNNRIGPRSGQRHFTAAP